MEEREKNFDKLFIEAVDEGLDVLGKSGRHMIFFYLEKSYSIRRHEIPKKPEAFAKGLEKIFGAGASALEKLIIRSLCTKFGIKYEEKEERPFADYVKEIKEAKDPEEARESRSHRGSFSNQQSLQVRHLQQSSVSTVELEKEEFPYLN
jgi:hypothetical protein